MGALAGIAGFAVGNWQRLLIYALVIMMLLGAAAGWGYHHGVQRLWDYQAEQARETVKVVIKQGKATERVITKYVKVQGVTETVTQTVEKEVVRYVDKNPGYCLDAEWRRLHDSAAANTVPDPAGTADAALGAPKAAEAIETVTPNYAACHRTADRLDALQEWVRQQAAVKP